MNYFFSFVVAILLAALILVEAKYPLVNQPKCPSNLLRLPKWISPRHYDLFLETDLDDELKFEGIVEIELEIGEYDDDDDNSPLRANQIALNADDEMDIKRITYRELSSNGNDIGEYIEVVSVCKQKEHDIIIVTLARNLLPHSRALLQLSFSRELSTNLSGYYRIRYETKDGDQKFMASTQFESDHARMAFPCFDEPAFKATFALTLVIPQDRQALSNMDPDYEETLPVSKVRRAPRKLIRFQDTPKMSSYLLAFVVGQFDYLEHQLDNGRVRVRVYAPVGKAQLAQLVLDTATRSLPLMEDYFDEPFPLKKLDFVSIPKLDAEAMENWGLITFAESSMLVDKEQCSKSMKNQLVQTVVHELGHQWFGNLVTMDWWDDLWLNEAFATWVEQNMTKTLYPELEFDYVFLLDQFTQAHNYDQWPNEPSVGFRGLEDSSLVDDLMGPIVYYKGATVIKYLQNEFVGPEMFKNAIRNYINEHQYANTKGDDLWRSMEHSSSKAVREFMESWLFQSGHPLISASYDPHDGKLHLSQRRFHRISMPLEAEEEKQIWMVPILILISDNQKREQVVEVNLNERTGSFELPDWFKPQQGHWMKLNVNSTGMYKVLYSNELFKNLRKAIEELKLPPIDRLNLLIEVRFLYEAQHVSEEFFKNFLYWFKNEQHMAVLESLQRALNSYSGSDKDKVEIDIFSHVFEEYAFNSKTEQKVSLLEERARQLIMFRLVESSHQESIKEALKIFDEYMKGAPLPEPFLRMSIYLAVAKNGTEKQKTELINMEKEAKSDEERDRIMHAFEMSDDPTLSDIAQNYEYNIL